MKKIIGLSAAVAALLGLAFLTGHLVDRAGAADESAKAGKIQAVGSWKTTFSDGLLNAAGKSVSLDKLKGKLVGIYFSAHWCPPCRAFTPKLVAFRDKNASDFEVVFVSLDRSQKAKDNYMKVENMKWLTVPFRAKSGKELMQQFHVRGIPTLIVLSPKGNTVSTRARMEVTLHPEKCIADWQETAGKVDKK